MCKCSYNLAPIPDPVPPPTELNIKKPYKLSHTSVSLQILSESLLKSSTD